MLKAQIEDRWLGLYKRIELVRSAGDPPGPLGNLVGRLNTVISLRGTFDKRERVIAKPLTFLPPDDLGGQPVDPLSFGLLPRLKLTTQRLAPGLNRFKRAFLAPAL